MPKQIYGVSWEGQILCSYDIVTVPSAVPRGGSYPEPRSTPDGMRVAGVGASSMSFNDTLQVAGYGGRDHT